MHYECLIMCFQEHSMPQHKQFVHSYIYTTPNFEQPQLHLEELMRQTNMKNMKFQ